MKKVFSIMGATGHIGQVIVDDLLKRGHTVCAIGRNEKKLHQLEIKGAVPISVDFTDADALTNAFKDAYAVFSFIPPGNAQNNFQKFEELVSDAIVKAINDSGVKRIVNLSSMGANLSAGTGLITLLYRHEQKLNELKNLITLIHLRPTYFMENLIPFITQMETEGIISSPLKENLAIPMVAARDIGWKASDFLDSTKEQPRLIFEFVGPQNLTMPNVAETFARAFDQPDLRYLEVPIEEERKRLIKAGMPSDFVDALLEMYGAFNKGLIIPTQDLKPSHHGRTTLGEFVQMITHRALAF